MFGKILGLTVKEELDILYNGQIYKLTFKGHNNLFNGMKLTKEELGQLKKLPSNVQEILSAKYYLKADVKEVIENKQTGFNL
jgi:hypothetical protein